MIIPPFFRLSSTARENEQTPPAVVFRAAGRLRDAGTVRRPVGRQLLRAELDPVRAQQVPPRTAAVRGRRIAAAAAAADVRTASKSARVHRPGETRESPLVVFDRLTGVRPKVAPDHLAYRSAAGTRSW